jgi:hypothetical protein
MAEPARQAYRKAGEAREVRRISAAVGLSALGLTCGLSAVAAAQEADGGPPTTTQPIPVAAAPRQIEEIDEEVVVQVPAPRPPAHAPALVSAGGVAAQRQVAPAGGAAAAQAAPVQSTMTGAQTVRPATPVATPKPVAVSTGSRVR